MKTTHRFLTTVRFLVAGAVAAGMVCGLALVAGSAEPKSDSSKATAKKSEPAPEKPKPKAKKLTGAELYAINCNRCHPERYPTEWRSAEWKTIMTHMRVRANLPAAQAKEILKYLQEDSGN